MKVKLIRIKSTNNNLRTNEVVGDVPEDMYPPQVEVPFYMEAPALEIPSGKRMIVTSYVQKILALTDDMCEFETENSTYRVERI